MEYIESPTPYIETLSKERLSALGVVALMALQLIISQQNDAIAERDRRLEIANNMALTDSLTGLSNRRAFDHDLEMLANDLSSMNRRGQTEAPGRFRRMLILGDIDYFKLVNDVLGYDLGDVTLAAVAQLFGQSMRQEDKKYRLGGDEFAAIIIVKRGKESDTFRAIAGKFYRHLDELRFSGELTPELEALQTIGMSFAYGVFDETPTSVDDLARTVSETMLRVKSIKEAKKANLRA